MTWVPIPDHPPYEASDDGRVRNADTGRVLGSGTCNVRGYKIVFLTGYGTMYVRHLVALTFLGPRPAGAVLRCPGARYNADVRNMYWGPRPRRRHRSEQPPHVDRSVLRELLRHKPGTGMRLEDIAAATGYSVFHVWRVGRELGVTGLRNHDGR